MSGLRRGCLAAVAVLLACSGCFATGSTTKGTPATGSAPRPAEQAHALPRLRPPTSPPPEQASPPPGLSSAGRSFVSAVNDFCHTFYSKQRSDSERYAGDTHAFAMAELSADRGLLEHLQRLRPPAS